MYTLFKRYTPPCALCLSALGLSSPLQAEEVSQASGLCGFSINAQFVEGAPRDRFIVKNTSSGVWQIAALQLDLGSSAGQLIFDITAEGAGVEVFQPFRGDGGAASLTQEPSVTDGDQVLELDFSSFTPGSEYRFSMDVDDQLTESELGQIRVSGSEMQGATLTFTVVDEQGAEQQVSGAFDENNSIAIATDAC